MQHIHIFGLDGVASEGEFNCPNELSAIYNKDHDISHIPNGWTVNRIN